MICFGYCEHGGISTLEKGKKMTSDVYVEILDEIRIDNKIWNKLFHQDDVPYHIPKCTIADNCIGILYWSV